MAARNVPATSLIPRVFERLPGEDGYRLVYRERGLCLEARNIRRRFSELWAEVKVLCDWSGAKTFQGSLATGDLNLSSLDKRQARAMHCHARSGTKDNDPDWQLLFEEFCVRIIEAERIGKQPIVLRDVVPSPRGREIEIEGIPILLHHPMILFGDGGSLKSYLALLIALNLARQGINVLYLDWELDAQDHFERLKQMAGGDLPANILYNGDLAQPLSDLLPSIRESVRSLSISYVICDSVAYASGGPPEKSEVSLAYMNAVRQFAPIGSLHLAHVSKAEDGDQKPFGSAFWHNSARSTWFVQRATDLPQDSPEVHVAAFHRKANTGRLRGTLGFRWLFTEDSVTFSREDVATSGSDQLNKKLPTWMRLRDAVRTGDRPVKELVDELGVSSTAIRMAAMRGKTMFTRTLGHDGETRIGLLERIPRDEGF